MSHQMFISEANGIYLSFYSFLSGGAGYWLLPAGFLELWRPGVTLQLRWSDFCLWGPLSLWTTGSTEHGPQGSRLSGFVAPRHVESSQTRDRTHASCKGRQSPNHGTTREVQKTFSSDLGEAPAGRWQGMTAITSPGKPKALHLSHRG